MIKQGLLLSTLLLLSALSWALDARYSGEMKDEYRIIEATTLKVLPSTNDYSIGLISMSCEEAEEECVAETGRFNASMQLIDEQRKPLAKSLLPEISGKKADVYIKRGTDTIELIRLYR